MFLSRNRFLIQRYAWPKAVLKIRGYLRFPYKERNYFLYPNVTHS